MVNKNRDFLLRLMVCGYMVSVLDNEEIKYPSMLMRLSEKEHQHQ